MKNVGMIDRVARVILGLILLSLVFIGPKTLWGLLGIIPIATAVISWCPAYHLLGIRSNKASSKPAGE